MAPGSDDERERRIEAIVTEIWLALSTLKLTRAAPLLANALRIEAEAEPNTQATGETELCADETEATTSCGC
jgi:hypothetical protein